MRICYSLDSWSHFFCSHFYNTLHGGYGMTILTTPFSSFSSESNPYSIHLLKPVNSTHSSHWNHFNWIHLFGDWIPFYSPCSYPFWWITPHLNQSFNSWVKQFSSTLYSLSLFCPHHQIPTTWSRICDHWIITYLAMSDLDPHNGCYIGRKWYYWAQERVKCELSVY